MNRANLPPREMGFYSAFVWLVNDDMRRHVASVFKDETAIANSIPFLVWNRLRKMEAKILKGV